MARRIRIRHPHYQVQNTLFTLPARDGQTGDHAHYPTVIAACSIITGNEDHIELSHHPDKASELNIHDDLLPAGNYFLRLPHFERSDTPYPIVPNFRSWVFPHNKLPHLWSDVAQDARNRASYSGASLDLLAGESCRITAERLACEDAHIIPSSENAWFTSNEMDQYGLIS